MITTIISMYWNCIYCSRLNIARGYIKYAIKKFILLNIDWFEIWCILVQTYQTDAVKCVDTFLIFWCPFQHSMSMSKSNDSRLAIRYMVSYLFQMLWQFYGFTHWYTSDTDSCLPLFPIVSHILLRMIFLCFTSVLTYDSKQKYFIDRNIGTAERKRRPSELKKRRHFMQCALVR